MTWLVHSVGDLKKVKKECKVQFEAAKTQVAANTEEAVLVELARKLVKRALKHHPHEMAVNVQANGHSTGIHWDSDAGEYKKAAQTISVVVSPISKPSE